MLSTCSPPTSTRIPQGKHGSNNEGHWLTEWFKRRTTKKETRKGAAAKFQGFRKTIEEHRALQKVRGGVAIGAASEESQQQSTDYLSDGTALASESVVAPVNPILLEGGGGDG